MKEIDRIPFPAELQSVDWLLEIGDLKSELREVTPEMMKKCSCRPVGRNAYERLWVGNGVLGEDFTVREQWRLDADGRWAGTVGFTGNDSKFFVEKIHFPRVRMRFPENGVRLLVGVTQGWVYRFSADHPDGVLASEPFGSLRMAAAMADGRCVYIDIRDRRNHLQNFLWRKTGNILEYHTLHLMPCAGRNRRSGAVRFENSVAILDGDWFEAARFYRKWALTTGNYQRRIRNNRQRELAIWLWNRGGSEYVIAPAEKLAADCGVPVALDWYWWHSNPYDTDYPEFWPPREGEAVFRAAQKRLKEHGIYCQVYINGLAWDVDTAGFESGGGRDSAVVDRDGSIHAYEFNCYTHHRLGYMCGEGEAFQRRLLELIGHLADAGLPGVYLDMIGCTALLPCYNPKHHHAPGGGNYQARGYRKLVREIRKRHPDLQLSTEGCNETFLDCFESGIILAPSMERYGCSENEDCVPAFSAVYHGANTLFGNYALLDGIPPWDPLWPPRDRWKHEEDWHAVCPDQFALELARTVSWGMQPTVCNLTMEQILDPRYAEDYRWIVTVARFYYENRKYLYDGTMLDPAGFTCGEIPVKFLQRKLFTTEDRKKILECQRPAVLHSCWQAPDGTAALILLNYSRQEQCCAWRGREFHLAARSCRCIEL